VADKRTGREALADVLSHELDIDLSDEFMKILDRMLVELWMLGFKIVPVDDKEEMAAA
jgi:hypothetical protein